MIRSRNKLFGSGRFKSSSLLTLNEIDEIEKKSDWRKNYLVNPKEIGRGHFSKVYQITCENRKQLLAAKIVRRRKGGIDRLEKIRKEADIIRKLNEKNIISVIQLFETHENFREVVLISEFAKGGSLFNLVQEFNKGLHQNYVKCVIFKILKALESMHLENIVHLDIKADNILLREFYPSSNIAICDFGLATELKKGINYKELVGTPDYMAPEIINYEKITFNADMWSVGVLIYFLLSGISPFMGQSKDETLMNVSKVRLLFDSVFNDSEYSDATRLISSLCVKSPNSRLSSSAAQCHSWFENIHTLNLDYPLVDTKIEVIPTKPSNSNPSISSNLNNCDIGSQSNDNLNNYNHDELINTQRCQSVDLDCINFDTKYKLLSTQSHSLISAVSYDNIFTDENDNDKDSIDYCSSTDEITNNNHTSLNKRQSLHQLSLVDEVADEMSYDCNGDIDLNNALLKSGKIETEDSNFETQNEEIEENRNMSEKLCLSEKLVNQVTNKLPEFSESSLKINDSNTKSNFVEKETVEITKCRESENIDDKLELSQIQITVSPDIQVNERKNENSTRLSNPKIPNKDLCSDPLDEYENIAGEEKCQRTKKEPHHSSSSDMDDEDDYRYTSLLTHFRLSELCNFL